MALTGCVIYDSGPTGPDRFPRVEGRWRILATAISSTCGLVSDEPFDARVVQNADLLQMSVDVVGFGEIRYDGWIDERGGFQVRQSTIYPRDAVRDESDVDGRFSRFGSTLSAREEEWITDLRTGRECSIVWNWSGRSAW